VSSKDAVIHEIQKLSKRGAGVSVKALKESWKGSAEAIKELEEEGLVLVMRAGKNDEKNAKFVFWNTQSRKEAEEMKVDDGWLIIHRLPSSLTRPLTEFRKLWAEQKVPEEPDVVRALNNGESNSRAIDPKNSTDGEMQRASRQLCPKISRLDPYHRGRKLARVLDRDQSNLRTRISQASTYPETMLAHLNPFKPFVTLEAAGERDCACPHKEKGSRGHMTPVYGLSLS